MPSGVYPEFKRGGKIPHPAAGLSKNKYNAKGEPIQRKSRSKLAKAAEQKLGSKVTNQKELATAVGKHLLPKLADVGIGTQSAFSGQVLAKNQLLLSKQPDMSAMKTLAPGISKDVDMSIIPDWAREIGRKPKLSSATVSDDDAYSDSSTTPTANVVNTIDHPDIAKAILKAAYDPRYAQSSSTKLGKRSVGFGSKMNPQDYGELGEFLTAEGKVRKRAKGGGRKKKSPVEQAIGMSIEDVDTVEQEPENVLESKALGQVIQNQPIINPPEADNSKPEIEDEYKAPEPEASLDDDFDFEGALDDLDKPVEVVPEKADSPVPEEPEEQSELIAALDKAESLGVSDMEFPANDFLGIELIGDPDLNDMEWEEVDDDQPEVMYNPVMTMTSRGPANIMIHVQEDTGEAEIIGFIYANDQYIMRPGYEFESED